ncbi:MAG: redoxin domain-containing protein [Bacteroidota bacterium]|nr:redoxin domain-containing protein [Bacteroidota bacterium]
MKRWQFAISVLLLWLYVSCASAYRQNTAAWQAQTTLKVQEYALQSNDEKAYIQLGKTPLTVLVFLSPECPLCKNYSLVLNRLQETFGSQVRFYGIVPGRTYSTSDVRQYVTAYKIQFPVWVDRQKALSNHVKATTTPEVILSAKSGSLIYRGAIDDWVQALGRKKAAPQQHYLEDAITRYLQNKDVLVKQTPPIGCLINEF